MNLHEFHPAAKLLLRFLDQKRGYLPREEVLRSFVHRVTPAAAPEVMQQVPAGHRAVVRAYVLAQFPGIEDPSYSILSSNGWHGPDDPFVVEFRVNLRGLRDYFASAGA